MEQQLLIAKCKKGDPRAQHAVYELYVKAMYNTVICIVPHQMEAEDIVQEAFIKAFAKIKQYREEASFGAWLKRIMINTALSALRKTSPVFTDLEVVEEWPEEDETQEAYPNGALIHAAIKELPEGCRVVFSLHLLEGYPQQKVAEMLHISESTVKTQYRRAKMLLREKLKTLAYEG